MVYWPEQIRRIESHKGVSISSSGARHIKKFGLLNVSLLAFVAALRAFPVRFLLRCVLPVPESFLATANARRILTALVAVAFITVDSFRYAFSVAGEAMALSASPNSKHYHMYLYQNVINII